MIKVLVNGKTYEVEKDKKLMRFLRDDLHLTSVKDGCSQGACGTCTAHEISRRLGISREVSRRYLEYLAEIRRAERRARYGARGLPQTEYLWNAEIERH